MSLMQNFVFNGGKLIDNQHQTTTHYLVEVLNTSCPFNIRDGIQLVSYNNELRLLGGWNIDEIPVTKKEDWVSIDGVNWGQGEDALWNLGRHRFICKVYQNKIWVMLNDPYNDTDKSMYTYDSINGWLSKGQLDIQESQNLYFHLLHTDVNGKEWIYFGGGQTNISPENGDTFNNYLHRWDGNVLEKVCDLPISMGNRSNSISWSINGKIFIAGGGEYHSNGNHTYNGSIWVSEDDGVTFNYYGFNDLLTAQYADMVVWDNKLWYIDGSNMNLGGNIQGLYSGTDPLNLTLVNGYGQIPARHACGICVHNDELYIVAGNRCNDSFKVKKLIV